MIYLDNNATTEPLPEVREAVLQVLRFGPSNPSSPHAAGEPARRLLTEARESVSELIGASPNQVVFTSSGTEANNLAINFILAQPARRRIVTTPLEHESVRQKIEILRASGILVDELPVDYTGRVWLSAAEKMITSDVGLVSVQWVNNETGIIQPVEQIATICHSRGVAFHTDAAQAIGKLPITISSFDPDFLSFAGHKLHAPMGIGVLFIRNPSCLPPLFGGGSQEFGLRPGSENLIGISGLAVACRLRRQRFNEVVSRMEQLRNIFEAGLIQACDGAVCNTPPGALRVCNTTNIRFPDVDGEALLAQLIMNGICCSQGSACTAHLPVPSHTLVAMGLTPQQAYQSIRFSMSELNTLDEVNSAIDTIATCYRRLKHFLSELAEIGGRT